MFSREKKLLSSKYFALAFLTKKVQKFKIACSFDNSKIILLRLDCSPMVKGVFKLKLIQRQKGIGDWIGVSTLEPMSNFTLNIKKMATILANFCKSGFSMLLT